MEQRIGNSKRSGHDFGTEIHDDFGNDEEQEESAGEKAKRKELNQIVASMRGLRRNWAANGLESVHDFWHIEKALDEQRQRANKVRVGIPFFWWFCLYCSSVPSNTGWRTLSGNAH